MAVPNFLSGAAANIVWQPFQGVATNFFAPVLARDSYASWFTRPYRRPGIPEYFSALNRGIITRQAAHEYLRAQGADWNGYTFEQWQEGLARDAQGNVDASPVARRSEWEVARLASLTRFGAGDVLNLWMRSHIPENRLRRELEIVGADADYYLARKNAFFQPIDLSGLMVARNRGLLGWEDFDLSLRHLGYKKPEQRELIDKLREQLPSISDLITFAIKDVWDEEAVGFGRLFDGLPPEFARWAAAQGLFGLSGIVAEINGVTRQATWPEVYWAAHWQPLAPTLAYQMFQRIRESRLPRFRALGLDVDTFSLQQLRQQLKVADYPPAVRDYLAAISYNPLRLLDIRRGLILNQRLATDPVFAANVPADVAQRAQAYDRQWAVEQFLDRGLHPEDAGTVADMAVIDARDEVFRPVRQLERKLRTDAIKAVIDAYAVGTIARTESLRLLRANGMSDVGSENALKLSDLRKDTALVKSAMAAIKRDYMLGVLDGAETWANLVRAGLTNEAAEYWRDKWQTQRDRTRRTATTQQLLKWHEEGLITLEEVQSRLTKLGWSEPDQLTLLREVRLHVERLQGRILAAGERQRKTQAKELASVARQASNTQKQAIQALRQAMPRVSIQSWLRKGLVNAAYARAKLTEQGWPSPTIELWIREALPDLSILEKSSNGTPKENPPKPLP